MQQLIPNIEKLGARLEAAYKRLADTLEIANDRAERALAAKVRLKEAQQSILLQHEDPKALGANEAARQAKIDDLTSDERAELADLEEEQRVAHQQVELARLEVEAARAQLRIQELLKEAAA